MGDSVQATGQNSFAQGYNTSAAAKNAIATGSGCKATFENASGWTTSEYGFSFK